ncbi:MAG: gephyrin-like molybdotransferase Glp [Candidatus Hydrothermarchaeaceae archaeon]
MKSVSMKGFYSLTPVDEALDTLLGMIRPIGSESMGIRQALGRALATDLRPERDIPAFDRAAMDGYALRGEETYGASDSNPVTFKVIGEVTAGEAVGPPVKKGEAVRISTGAPVPKGADAVVMLEYTRAGDGTMEVLRSLPPGKNVSSRGEDAKRGELLLSRGSILRPQDIAILAAMGMKEVEVSRKPMMGIISTGNELVDPGEELSGGQIYDSNSYSLSALVEMNGGTPVRMEMLRDDPTVLKEALKNVPEYDAVVLSGATSVGEKDHIPMVVREMGEIVVHGVAMRPGKPVGFGFVSGRPVFMLPGSPVAAMFAFEVFARPAMQRMMGVEPKSPYPPVRAVLGRKIPSELGRRDFVRVKLLQKDKLYAEPLSTSGAGVISTMVKADGFVIVPENVEGVQEGEEAVVYLYSFHL